MRNACNRLKTQRLRGGWAECAGLFPCDPCVPCRLPEPPVSPDYKNLLDRKFKIRYIMERMEKKVSTDKAAEEAGIHPVTLRRWLASKSIRPKIQPSVATPMEGRTLWRWTTADVEKLKAYKAAHYRKGRGRKKMVAELSPRAGTERDKPSSAEPKQAPRSIPASRPRRKAKKKPRRKLRRTVVSRQQEAPKRAEARDWYSLGVHSR